MFLTCGAEEGSYLLTYRIKYATISMTEVNCTLPIGGVYMKNRQNGGEALLLLLVTILIVILLVGLLGPMIWEAVSSPGYKKPLAHDMEGWGHDPNLP